MTIKIDCKLNTIESNLIKNLSDRESEKISGGWGRLSISSRFKRRSRGLPSISRKFAPRISRRASRPSRPGILMIGNHWY